MRGAALSVLCVAAVLVAGCGTTRIVESWTAPGLEASDLAFEHVIAIAVLAEESSQRIAEDTIASTATSTKVTPAYTLVSAEDRADVERLRRVLTEHGIDGAITVRLVGVEKVQTYVPGTTRAYPGGYYGYYRRSGTVVQDPGYVRRDKYVTVETSLHEVASGKLLWSGVSESMNPGSVGGMIEEIAR